MTPTAGTPDHPEDEQGGNAAAVEALQLENLAELDAPIGDAARFEIEQRAAGREPNLFDGNVHVIVGRPRRNPAAKPRRIYPAGRHRDYVTLKADAAAPQKAWETWELDVVRAFARKRDWITWSSKPGGFDLTPGVVGKEYRVDRGLLAKLNAVAVKGGVTAEIISGFRSYASQLKLWLLFLAGLGNPANPPGTSNHEAKKGDPATAADVYIRGVAFWTYVNARPQLAAYARRIGLTQPHSNEPWHVERK